MSFAVGLGRPNITLDAQVDQQMLIFTDQLVIPKVLQKSEDETSFHKLGESRCNYFRRVVD